MITDRLRGQTRQNSLLEGIGHTITRLAGAGRREEFLLQLFELHTFAKLQTPRRRSGLQTTAGLGLRLRGSVAALTLNPDLVRNPHPILIHKYLSLVIRPRI